MKRFTLSALFLTLMASALVAQQPVEYRGKLQPELKFGSGMGMILLSPASEAELALLPAKLKESEQGFAAKVTLSRAKKISSQVLFVEPKAPKESAEAKESNASGEPKKPQDAKLGDSYLYADLNLDGKLGDDERLSFAAVTESNREYGEIVLKFPLANSPYKFYPIRLRQQKGVPLPTGKAFEGKRALLVSFDVLAEGTVDIGGKKTLVQYTLSYDNAAINLTDGRLAMDTDLDGKIDASFVSPETAYAKNETVVFRVGEQYLSTKSVDPATGDIVLKTHPASDYQRIELKIGATLPDYGFTDFDGKARRLAEFRGKYLLIDFWGTWCGPCVAEIPHLKEAYEKYKAHGFEILGMDFDPPQMSAEKPLTDDEKGAAKQAAIDKVKKFMTEKGMTWTQATTDSIQDLLDKRFRITAYPTTVLLDPQGKIISLGQREQMPLRGKELFTTLEKLMPTKPDAERAAPPSKSGN